MRALALVCCLALAAVGCEDKPSSPPPAKATAASSASAAAADPNAELDNEDIPVAEDFEEEAQKEITKDNLESKLEDIEKELADDKG